MENLLPDHIFESYNNRQITTHICIYLNTRSDPRVHLDNKSREGNACKLLLSKEHLDVDMKTLNAIKVDEVIKKLHSLLTSLERNHVYHMY